MPPKPFKPPRPISSTSTSTTTSKSTSKPTRTVSAPSTTTSARATKPTTNKSKTKSKSTTPILPDLTDSDDNNNNPIEEDINILSSDNDDEDTTLGATAQEKPTFSPKLISRLLHEHFQNTDTRITKEALEVVCRYVDVFAREAVARCCFGKEAGDGDGEGMGMEGDFLEVSLSE